MREPCLYRAVDKHVTPIDFLLTAKRDLEAAKRFFRKMLQDEPLLAPDRIGTDGAGLYPPAITAAAAETPAIISRRLIMRILPSSLGISGLRPAAHRRAALNVGSIRIPTA